CGRGILNPLCLPISPLGHERNNRGRMKTWQVSLRLFAFFSSNSCAYLAKFFIFNQKTINCHEFFIDLRS
ncbi:MAG: hypothetical protein ACN6NM_09080, partial [Acinetobacter bohemicus]